MEMRESRENGNEKLRGDLRDRVFWKEVSTETGCCGIMVAICLTIFNSVPNRSDEFLDFKKTDVLLQWDSGGEDTIIHVYRWT